MVSDPLIENLFDLYNFGLYPSLYCRLRCRVSPFNKMEEFIPKEGLIYDFGCGEGVFANFLSLKSAKREVVGIEIHTKKFHVAKFAGERNSRKITFLNENILSKENILLNCNGVILSDFLHHIHYEFHQILLEKIFNSLNPGGILLIRDVNKSFYSWRFWGNFVLELIFYPFQRYYFVSLNDRVSLLEKIGFKVKHILSKEGLPFSNTLFICKKQK